LLDVSKLNNALYNFFNCIEKTLFPPPCSSKRADEAVDPSVVDESVNADEGMEAA
jgi:hypothetical protein